MEHKNERIIAEKQTTHDTHRRDLGLQDPWSFCDPLAGLYATQGEPSYDPHRS